MSETRARRTGHASSELLPGDIMIKYNSGGAGYAIQFGQLFGRGGSQYTHAGIMDSPTTIIEMSKSGIGRNNLLIKNVDLVYKVYRCIFPDVAAGATETAKMMFDGVQAEVDGVQAKRNED